MRQPNVFDISPIKIVAKNKWVKFEISKWQMRDLIQIYQLLKSRRYPKKAKDLRAFLCEVAKAYDYFDFNPDDKVSMKMVGVSNEF